MMKDAYKCSRGFLIIQCPVGMPCNAAAEHACNTPTATVGVMAVKYFEGNFRVSIVDKAAVMSHGRHTKSWAVQNSLKTVHQSVLRFSWPATSSCLALTHQL